MVKHVFVCLFFVFLFLFFFFLPWSNMVGHVIPCSTMVNHVLASSVLPSASLLFQYVTVIDHGQTWQLVSWSSMVDHVREVPVSESKFDHGRPWSNLCHLTFMVDHGQTMVIPLLDHGKPWPVTMVIHGKTMVNHGLTMVLSPYL